MLPSVMDSNTMRQATLTLLHTSEGGRKTSILSGYRPHFVFETGQATDGMVEIDNQMVPGETRLVKISFLRPEEAPTHASFKVMEGAKVVATGKLSN